MPSLICGDYKSITKAPTLYCLRNLQPSKIIRNDPFPAMTHFPARGSDRSCAADYSTRGVRPHWPLRSSRKLALNHEYHECESRLVGSGVLLDGPVLIAASLNGCAAG